MFIAIIKSIIRFFIAMSFGFALYFFSSNERLYEFLGPYGLIIAAFVMLFAVTLFSIGFSLQPVGSLQRNSIEQIKDTKGLRYFCSIMIFIMIVITLPSLCVSVGLWAIPLTLFWCGCLLLFIFEGYK